MPTIRLKALIVDDEKAIRRFLRSTLVAEDFEVVEAETIAEARAAGEKLKPDLVVLDLGLPDGDGTELIASFIAMSKPAILVLSALDEEARKVQALNLGADDFITKPFGVAEFMARVRVALRHRVQMQGAPAIYDDGRLYVDLGKRIVRVGGEDPKLTPREYGLLHQLVLHAGKVLTHRQLLQSAWPDDASADVQALRVHVRHLRQKVEINPDAPVLVSTEPGVGYRFTPPS
ncbi:response regulator [Terricaulis sp.]|uniref:response regulator n=1 Tax=Terricaulis sp. TaxID=2768686 RepID=UPI002AC6F854|nr:response regulator [Terricaulis sp.]MDZ4689875.1 response regulator [Terricaulis sp.]